MASPSYIGREEEDVLLALVEDEDSISLASKQPQALENEIEDGLSFDLSISRRRKSFWQRLLMTLRKRRRSVGHDRLEHETGCNKHVELSRSWRHRKRGVCLGLAITILCVL